MKRATQMQSARRCRPLLLLAAAVGLWSGPAQGASYTWTATNAGTYAWNTADNWGGGDFPNGTGDVANLNIDLAGDQTVNLSQGITLGVLNIGDTNSAYRSTTLANGTGGFLTFDVDAGNAQINRTAVSNNVTDTISATLVLNASLDIANGSAGPLTISPGPITAGTLGTKTISNLGSGAGRISLGSNGSINDGTASGKVAIVQNSIGALWLGGNPIGSYSGGTIVKKGTVLVQQNTPGTGAVTLGDPAGGSASLLLQGNNKDVAITGAAQALNLAAGAVGKLTIGGGGGYKATFGGPISLNGQTLTIAPDSAAGAVLVTGTVTGPGGIDNAGTGVTTISGDISATGITNSSASSMLNLGGTNSAAAVHMVFAGTLSLRKQASVSGGVAGITTNTVTVESGGTLGLGVGTSPTYFDSEDVAAVLAALGGDPAVGLKPGAFIGLDTSAGNFTHSASIGNLSGGGALGLAKLGANTLTLSAANTYSNGTLISGGTLEVSADENLGAAGTAVSFSFGGLLGSGTNIVTMGRPMMVGAGGGGFASIKPGNLTVAAAISGNGTLYVAGSGIVTFDNCTNTLSGLLTVGPAGSTGASLVITNCLLNTAAGATIGNGVSNTVVVTGSGAVWTNSGTLTVGNGGVGNGLTVADGGKVYVNGSVAVATYSPGSSGHRVTVTGTNSELNATGAFTMWRMSGCSLNISSGGVVRAASYGQSDSSANGVTIDGAGSRFELSGQVSVSAKQAGPATSHYLVITNGGGMKGASGVIGNTGPEGINNAVTVTGLGSVWTNTGPLTIYGTYSNRLTVIDKGQVVGSTSLSVGNGAGAAYNNSSVFVGSSGLLKVNGKMTLGNIGSTGNKLTIDGGVVWCEDIAINKTDTARNSLDFIDDRAENVSESAGALYVRKGTAFPRTVAGMEALIADGNITLEEAVAPEMFTVAEIGVDPDTYIQVKLRPRSPGATLIVR